MTYINIAKELLTFSDKFYYSDCKVTIGINDEMTYRIVLSRLYYSLYNKLILEDFDLIHSTLGGKHKKLETLFVLREGDSEDIDEALDLLIILKSLRVWADYQPTEPIPLFDYADLLDRVDYILRVPKLL